jgi:hypothetical protein
MRIVLTALIFLIGIGFVLAGIGFLVDPAGSAANFGLAPQGNQGLAVLRADMTAFFVVAGLAMLYGAWKRDGDAMLVAALLLGIAFAGRLVGVFADGTYPGFWLPMLGEAFVVVVTLIASRVLPHHIADGIDD